MTNRRIGFYVVLIAVGLAVLTVACGSSSEQPLSDTPPEARGQEEPQEEPRPPGPHAMDSFDPDNLPASGPMMEPGPSRFFTLEDVTAECVDGKLRVSLRTAETFADAEVTFTPLSEPIPYPGGAGLRHPKAGDAQVIALLPGSLAGGRGTVIDNAPVVIDGGYHSLAVTMQGTDEDGLQHRSLPILLLAEDISCPSVS